MQTPSANNNAILYVVVVIVICGCTGQVYIGAGNRAYNALRKLRTLPLMNGSNGNAINLFCSGKGSRTNKRGQSDGKYKC